LQASGHLVGSLDRRGRQTCAIERVDMAQVVLDLAGFEPALESREREFVGEVFTPQGGEFHAGFGERCVEIEHTDQAGPLSAPVGESEDRTLMRNKTGQNMVAILPDGLDHHERRIRGNAGEDLHAVAL